MTRLTGLPELTTVLLPESVPMRPFETEDGRRGMVRDLSYLEFVVEALIAQSAVRLAVCPASSFYDDFSFLPHALRSRIVKVDTNSEAYEKAFAVLLPVITEHGIKISGEASVFESTSEMDSRITNALCRALIDLRRLLVGITHRCQVPLDPAAMLSAIDVLRASVTTPDARGNLAAIEGILNAYEPLATPSLHVRHGIEIDRVRAFSRFASDETYRAMSYEAGLLGIPAKATLAVLGMRRKCAELLARPKVADLFEAGTQSLAVVTKDVALKPSLLGRLLSPDSDYLPPLVNLAPASTRAHTEWQAASPPLRIPKGLQREVRIFPPPGDTQKP
jgi:hypothetical protein